MKRLTLIMTIIALGLTAATPAYAQTAVNDAYGGQQGEVLGTVNSGGGGGNGPTSESAPAPQQVAAATTTSGSSLPFTGLDVGLLVLGGIVLVGVGVGLRRFARPLN